MLRRRKRTAQPYYWNSNPKVVVLGERGVGKSFLVTHFSEGHFIETGYDPTIEGSYRRQYVVDDETVVPDVLDIQNQQEYVAMADQWTRDSNCVMLVFR
jgi:GTPase KRas protein